MCLVKKPSIPKQDPAAANKPLPVIRNPMLDGMLGDIAAIRAGTSAFRIDLLNPLSIPSGGGTGVGGGGGGGSGGSGSSGGGSSSSGGSSTSSGSYNYHNPSSGFGAPF